MGKRPGSAAAGPRAAVRCALLLLGGLLFAGPAPAQDEQAVRRAQSQALERQAREHQVAERFDEAREAYARALELWPDNDQALNNLAWMLLSSPRGEDQDPKQRAEVALGYAQRAVALKPQAATHVDTLAAALDAADRPAEAARTEAQAVRLDPKTPAYGAGLLRFAERALQGGGLEDAERAELLVLAALGRVRSGAQGQALRQALRSLDEAAALAPAGAEALTLRAQVLVGLGQDELAVRAADEALSQGATDPGLRSLRAEALLRLGRFEEGAQALEEASAQRPKDYDLRLRLAALWSKAGRADAVARVVAAALKDLDAHGPLWPGPWAQKACALAARAQQRAQAQSEGAELRARRAQAITWWARAQAARADGGAAKALAEQLEAAGHALAKEPPADRARGLAEELLGQTGLPRFVDASEQLAARGGRRLAFADVDGDGDPDLFLSGAGLLLNDGAGHFARAKDCGVAGGRGGVFADYDRDGDLDLFVAGGGPDRLYRNDSADGRVRFVDVTQASGLRDDGFPSEGVAWADVNGDRFPDLYVANYEQKNEAGAVVGTADRLWLSDGAGRFLPGHAGVRQAPALCGRGVNPADFDQDGDVDLFVSNYRLQRNLFFVNEEGALREEAVKRGVAGTPVRGAYGHTIGSAWGDLDGDGDLDLVSANLAHPRFIAFSDRTAVFLQGEDGRFAEAPGTAGIWFEETHSHPLLWDMDDDGDLDLLLTSVYGDRPSFTYRNRLVEDGALRFEDVSWATGTRIWDGWGAATADVDLDGDLDLAVCGKGGVRLWLRQEAGEARSVRVRLRGAESDTWGAYATATLEVGERRLVRQVSLGSGTACQSEPILHFGVGDPKDRRFRLSVRWPSGKTTTTTVGAGRYDLDEVEGSATARPWRPSAGPRSPPPGRRP